LSESLPHSPGPDTLSDITSTCVRKVRKSPVGHIVGVMLKHCPIFPQGVSEIWQSDSRRTVPDTLSDIPSTGVRKVRKSAIGHRVGVMLKHCPIFPQGVSEIWQSDSRRTVPDTLPDITSTGVRNVRKSAAGHRVGVMLKHCPIFPQRVSEILQPDSPGHVVRLNLNMCPKSPKFGSLTVPDTLPDITSTGVRNVRNLAAGQSRTRCQT